MFFKGKHEAARMELRFINKTGNRHFDKPSIAYIQLHTYNYIHTFTYIHLHTYIYIHKYIHTYTHTYIQLLTYNYIHTITYIHTYIHTYIQLHTITYNYIQLHTYIHICIYCMANYFLICYIHRLQLYDITLKILKSWFLLENCPLIFERYRQVLFHN